MAQDDDEDKAPLTKRFVVTYSGKRKNKEDVPPEITPEEPSHIVSSPIDVEKEAPELPVLENQVSDKISFSNQTEELPPLAGLNEPITINEPIKTITMSATIEHKSAESEPTYSSDTMSASIEPKSAARETNYSSNEPPQPPPPPPSGPSQPPQRRGLGTFMNGLMSLAVIFLAINAYYLNTSFNELQAQSQDEKSSVLAVSARAKHTLSEISNLQERNKNQLTDLETLKKEVMNSQSRLSTLSGNKEWVLAEVQFLALMANEHLRTHHDTGTALAQLQAAKQRVDHLSDASLQPLKEALTKDIAQISALPVIDRTQLWDKTTNLLNGVQELQFKTIHTVANKNTNDDNNNLPRWKRSLLKSWEEIKGIIRVTRQNENEIPLALSLQEKAQILRTLQLMCEQIQWAALAGNSTVYQSTLDDLQTNIKHYFEPNDKQIALINNIAQLKKETITIAPPVLASPAILSQIRKV